MKTAERNGHTAILSYDKLYVDRKQDDRECVELVNRCVQQWDNQNYTVGERIDQMAHVLSPNQATGSTSAPSSPMQASLSGG